MREMTKRLHVCMDGGIRAGVSRSTILPAELGLFSFCCTVLKRSEHVSIETHVTLNALNQLRLKPTRIKLLLTVVFFTNAHLRLLCKSNDFLLTLASFIEKGVANLPSTVLFAYDTSFRTKQ